jgi:glyoxylase-like metal-dependent hydrolase (beta-lactamase superfamily II)
MLTYVCVPVGPLESNTYLLKDAATGALAMVDCAAFSPPVQRAVAEQGGDLRYILLTHGHFDHILGVPAVAQAYPNAQICIGEPDAGYLRGELESLPGHPRGIPTAPHRLLADGDMISLGKSRLRAIAAPGHTGGGLCYEEAGDRTQGAGERLLLTGDTLFFEEVGRADLPGGNWEALQETVRRLYTLAGDYVVLPGHGPASTLSHERRHNPYVRG